jgi:hypothetical protein
MPAKKGAPAQTKEKPLSAKKPDTKAETEAKAAKATASKAPAAKADATRPQVEKAKADAKATPAKATPKAAAPKKAAPPARRAVARPVTRVITTKAERAEARRVDDEKPEKRVKAPGKALPTAPEGHAPLINADGSSSGSIALPEVLAKPAKRVATLFQALMAARANARQATASTKNRHNVAGGGAKPWRQ